MFVCHIQIKKQQLNKESFWAKTSEEDFESLELFQELEQSFGTGRARNLELDKEPKLKLPKIKELKVLDAKSAQNICKIIAQLCTLVHCAGVATKYNK